MTFILLAVSFLVFYALGMSAYRRQPIVIVRSNDTNIKQGSDVFYHHVIARSAYVPFTLFSDYLSFMATQYPFLRFNVYFLIDDSWHTKYPHPIFLNRLVPHLSNSFKTAFNQNHQKDIRVFQKRYQNVKINVMYLSKYMAMTPLRFKWKMIPQSYLSFYARIYEIWQNGGIGFDLVTFNDNFNINKRLDQRIDTILKQHSNGFDVGKYEDVLDSLDNEEQNDLFSMFFNLMNNILNETRLFLNTDFTGNATPVNKNLIDNTRRNKRDMGYIVHNNTSKNFTLNKNVSILKKIDHNDSLISDNSSTTIKNITESSFNNSIEEIKQYDIKLPNISGHLPQIWFFYDISNYPDDSSPSFLLPKLYLQSSEASKNIVANSKKSNYLSLSPDGLFIAASSRHHPFLAQLFSSSCHRLSPKYAIKDTLFSQCSGFLRDDIYCENIRLIYNAI